MYFKSIFNNMHLQSPYYLICCSLLLQGILKLHGSDDTARQDLFPTVEPKNALWRRSSKQHLPMKQSPVRNRHCPRYGLSVSNEQLDVLKQWIAPLHKSKDDPHGFQHYAQAVIMFEQDSKTTWISNHI